MSMCVRIFRCLKKWHLNLIEVTSLERDLAEPCDRNQACCFFYAEEMMPYDVIRRVKREK